MKTTIKLGKAKSIIVKPSPRGLSFEVCVAGVVLVCDHLTPDQCGALMFGMETALEVGRLANERAASEFNAPDTATPFPALGGELQCPPCNGDCNQGRTCPARKPAASIQSLLHAQDMAGVAA